MATDMTEFRARIQIPMYTDDEWTSMDPVLLKGELVIVQTDDGIKMKVGDGTGVYSALEFI